VTQGTTISSLPKRPVTMTPQKERLDERKKQRHAAMIIDSSTTRNSLDP
jgi:hypothetical protein